MVTAPVWPVVRRCECGRLRQEHYFVQADTEHLRPRGMENGTCDGYVEASVEERPPPGELRRRLKAVLALHEHDMFGLPDGYAGRCGECSGEDGYVTWPCATVRAARGETA